MIESFGNGVAEDIWLTNKTKHLPVQMHLRAKVLLTIMHASSKLEDLLIKGQPPKVRLRKLNGDKKDYWSVTIQLPYCITFKFKNGIFSDVRIENYHRG